MSNQSTLLQTLLQTLPNESHDELVTPPDCWGLLVPLSSGQPGGTIPLRKHSQPGVPEPKRHTFKIGRGDSNDLVLSGHNISREHCTLTWVPSGHVGESPNNENTYVYVEDNSGKTYINSKLLGQGRNARLRVGNELSFGQGVNRDYRYLLRLPPAPPAVSGGIFEQYDLGAELGHGTFGIVHKALHRATGKWFACKIVSKSQFAQNPRKLELVRREVGVLRNLDHPHICKLVDDFEDQLAIWLILEFVGGGNLGEAVTQRGRLSESEARQFTMEICRAIEYAHLKGVVHRDIKPENILLTDTVPQRIKVADFGLAKDVGGDTLLQTFCGTPVYLAPEIALGKGVKAYTPRVDSWSIGMVAWVVLTGAVPFVDDGGPALTHFERQSINWSYLSSLGLSTKCIDWIQKMLAFDPTQRMTIREALGHPWLAVEHGSEVNEVASASSSSWTVGAAATQGATVVPTLLVLSSSNSVGSSSTHVPQGEVNTGDLPAAAVPTPMPGQAHVQQLGSFLSLPETGKIERRWGRRFTPTGGNALRRSQSAFN